MKEGPVYRLLTRDPASGVELIVTRLEAPESGVIIEGKFSLGWMGKLNPEQLDFVGVLLKNRNNLQKIATDLGVAYNTARSRLDDIVAALGGEAGEPEPAEKAKAEALQGLAEGEVSFEETLARLKASKKPGGTR